METRKKHFDQFGNENVPAFRRVNGKLIDTGEWFLEPVSWNKFLKEHPTEEQAEVICHIYLITDGEFFKIGRAIDVDKRLSDLQLGNPKTLSLVFYAPVGNASKVESHLHRLYSYKLIHREWFSLNEVDVSEIKKYLRFIKLK